MKNGFLAIGLLICLITAVEAMGGSAPSAPTAEKQENSTSAVFLIDDFESGSLSSPNEWWTFDIEKAEIDGNSDLKMGEDEVVSAIGEYSLLLNGPARNWYAGGVGYYLAKENQNLAVYNALVIDVFGTGPNSGTIKVELFDDDNNNWQVEQDASRNYAPIYDDKLVTDIRVDWRGWQRVTIPLADFVDDNDGVGDDVWNPEQGNGSGGLLQIQLICLANKAEGAINVNLDNISLISSEE